MTAPESVLGVLGVCWVGFRDQAQAEAANGEGLRGVCWVCWVLPRACACAVFYSVGVGLGSSEKFLYARAEKPSTPNTPNTDALKALIYIGFKCVGFVSGWAVLCWVGVAAQEARHD